MNLKPGTMPRAEPKKPLPSEISEGTSATNFTWETDQMDQRNQSIYNPRAEISKMNQVRPTLVNKGATLGANCTTVCGHTIGRYAFLGAGAVVTKDVPDHALMVGNPAKQIGWMCKCGERLDTEEIYKICGCKQNKDKVSHPLTSHAAPLTSI